MKYENMINDDNISFDDFYTILRDDEIGNWDSINSEEIIKEYCCKQIKEGIHVSHILEALEKHPGAECYRIWLGNSMETPEPINTKQQLYDALEINEVEE